MVRLNYLMKAANDSRLLKIAYVAKAHGVRGEVFVQPFNEKAQWPPIIKEIFIGSAVFSVHSHRPHKKGWIFELKECPNRSSAEALKQKPVFLPRDLFISKKGEFVYLAELVSFCVQVAGYGQIGSIQSFQSNGFQDFLIIGPTKERPSFSIPLVPPYIKNIDFVKKTVTLDLPKNFLEFCAPLRP